MLGDLGLPYGEPDPERSYEAIFSLVVDRSEGKTRQLPALYFGGARVYVDRDPARVADRVRLIYDGVMAAPTTPTYQVAACRVGDRYGLYLADFCNRTRFRQRLTRQGIEFADTPFVRFTPSGKFACDDWGEYPASFLILTGDEGDPMQLIRPARGYLVMSFVALRLGDIEPAELARLAAAIRGLDAVGAADAATLVSALSA